MEVHTIFGSVNPGRCILLSDLETLEVCTIFGSKNRGSVYYVRM